MANSIPCTDCGHMETKVVDTRPSALSAGVEAIRRRRKCVACGSSHTTYELTKSSLNVIAVRGVEAAITSIQQAVDVAGASAGSIIDEQSEAKKESAYNFVTVPARNQLRQLVSEGVPVLTAADRLGIPHGTARHIIDKSGGAASLRAPRMAAE